MIPRFAVIAATLTFAMVTGSLCAETMVCSGMKDGFWQIFTCDPDTGVFRQLTDSPWDKYRPVWIGKRIVFEGRQALWFLENNSPEKCRKLDLPSGSAEPRWLGKAVLGYTLYRNTVTDNSAVYTFDLETGKRSKIFDKPYLDRQLDCAKGVFVWVSGAEMQGFEIWVCLDLAEGGWQITANRENDFNPRISPDGKQVVFQSYMERNSRIIIQTILGYEETVIDVPDALESCPCWPEDASSVFFVSDRNGCLQIFRYGISSGETRSISPKGFDFMDPDIRWAER